MTGGAPDSSAPSRSENTLLPLLRRPHFSPYRTYLRRDFEMVVVLNPKVATTTFRQVLLDALETTGAKPQLSRLWPVDQRRRHLIAPPADYLNMLLHPERYQFFGFVRNPYSRLVSAWRDKCRLDSNGLPLARSMKREMPVIRKFADSAGLAGAGVGSEIPFPTFVSYVESQAEGTRNHHWDTQCAVLSTDLIDYDRLYRLENELIKGMSRILSGLKLPEGWLEDRLSRPLNQNRIPPEPVYNRELAHRVYALYRKDFELLGYERDSWQLEKDANDA